MTAASSSPSNRSTGPAPVGPSRFRSSAIVILLSTLAIHALIGFFALRSGHSGANGQDFFIISTGTRQASLGMNPYTPRYMRDALKSRFPDSGDSATLEGGFFYPPQSMLIFRPFSLLPFPAGFFSWYVFSTILLVTCGGVMFVDARPLDQTRFAASVVIGCLLVNPLTQRMLSLGQTSMIVPAAFVIGHLLIERRWRWLGPAVYSFAAIKPHLALPLLVIMPLLYSWREAVRCAAFIVLFNLLGCLMTTGSISTISDFVRYAGTGPLSIGFNQVTYDQVISWNRILYVLSGIPINLSVSQIVAGYLIIGALLWVRVVWIQRAQPSRSLLIAIATMSSLFCSQPKGYDFVIVILISPYVWRLWREGDWKSVVVLFALFLLASTPRGVAVAAANHLHLAESATQVVLSYRAFVVFFMLLVILLRGEPSEDLVGDDFDAATLHPG